MNKFFKIVLILIFFFSCDQPIEIIRHAPIIHSINLSRTILFPDEFIIVEADVTDEDEGDELSYLWQSTNGQFVEIHNNPTHWYAPDYPDTCTLTLTVSDGYFKASKSALVYVISQR